MKIVNRGYVMVHPKQAFIDWANKHDEDMEVFDDMEPSVYLIEEDFFDEEPLVKKYFKRIFMNEIESVTENTEVYPEITEENFLEWFELDFGTAVFDAETDQLRSE